MCRKNLVHEGEPIRCGAEERSRESYNREITGEPGSVSPGNALSTKMGLLSLRLSRLSQPTAIIVPM